MAKSKDITELLFKMTNGTLSLEPLQTQELLSTGLASKTAILVIQSAELIGKLKVTQLEAELRAVYQRNCGEEMRKDKQCRIKCAVIKALHEIRSEQTDLYRHGMECYWPSKPQPDHRDDAAELRIASAYAYAELGQPNEIDELAGLLADPVGDVRMAAVRCIAAIGGIHCYLLLRLKTLIGDSNVTVMEACFESLVERDKLKAIPLIGEFLLHENERIRASAALALSQTRQPQAFDILVSAWTNTTDPDEKQNLLIAIALLRLDSATNFLLGLLDHHHLTACDALRALKYCPNPEIRAKVERLVDENGSSKLRSVFEELFE